jgi:hypothetical protein
VVGTRGQCAKENSRLDDESSNKTGYTAEVVEQRTAVAGEEDSVAHQIQMKERGMAAKKP